MAEQEVLGIQGRSTLMYALQTQDPYALIDECAVLRSLLDKQCGISDNNGFTALMAVSLANPDLLQCTWAAPLLELCGQRDRWGDTALMRLFESGKLTHYFVKNTTL